MSNVTGTAGAGSALTTQDAINNANQMQAENIQNQIALMTMQNRHNKENEAMQALKGTMDKGHAVREKFVDSLGR
jgi:hypothetical protein